MLDPKRPNLQHRASKLTEPGCRPSSLAESIRPVILNSGTRRHASEVYIFVKTFSSLNVPWEGAHEALPEVIYSECITACIENQLSPGNSELYIPDASRPLEE